ncbi:MAG TPA: hypothetical protein DEP72_02010 [Clostridiales bacterium]|nr:MAG: hypothetical protein A2Y18_00205 [Clostridiales bacterium GWD2_32_19]HCC06930.1 hypothetical protein [Clostridiales bacterium]
MGGKLKIIVLVATIFAAAYIDENYKAHKEEKRIIEESENESSLKVTLPNGMTATLVLNENNNVVVDQGSGKTVTYYPTYRDADFEGNKMVIKYPDGKEQEFKGEEVSNDTKGDLQEVYDKVLDRYFQEQDIELHKLIEDEDTLETVEAQP